MIVRAAQWVLLGGLLCLSWPSVATFSEERWQARLDSGKPIEMVLRRPAEVATPRPAIILFGGFGSAAQVLDAVDAAPDYIRASFAYPWTPPARIRPWTIPALLKDFEAAVADTFAGINLLVASLRARADVDATRIHIVGVSAGAPFATIAGVRERVPAVVIVQGYGDLGAVIGRQFELSWVPKFGRWSAWPARALGRYLVWQLDLPAPEDAARRFTAEQRVLLVTARQDQRIPAQAAELLWSAIQDSPARASRIDLPGEHLRGLDDPAIAEILRRVLGWAGQGH